MSWSKCSILGSYETPRWSHLHIICASHGSTWGCRTDNTISAYFVVVLTPQVQSYYHCYHYCEYFADPGSSNSSTLHSMSVPSCWNPGHDLPFHVFCRPTTTQQINLSTVRNFQTNSLSMTTPSTHSQCTYRES